MSLFTIYAYGSDVIKAHTVNSNNEAIATILNDTWGGSVTLNVDTLPAGISMNGWADGGAANKFKCFVRNNRSGLTWGLNPSDWHFKDQSAGGFLPIPSENDELSNFILAFNQSDYSVTRTGAGLFIGGNDLLAGAWIPEWIGMVTGYVTGIIVPEPILEYSDVQEILNIQFYNQLQNKSFITLGSGNIVTYTVYTSDNLEEKLVVTAKAYAEGGAYLCDLPVTPDVVYNGDVTGSVKTDFEIDMTPIIDNFNVTVKLGISIQRM